MSCEALFDQLTSSIRSFLIFAFWFLQKVIDGSCCSGKCVEAMDLAEMWMIRKSLQGTNLLQRRQIVLEWLWMHAKPNERCVLIAKILLSFITSRD